MLKCPVCPREDIMEGANRCPGCGVDLTPIHRVRELPMQQFREAFALARLGKCEEALIYAAAAVALLPGVARARALYAKLLWNCGLHAVSLAEFDRAVQALPADDQLRRDAQQAKSWANRQRWISAALRSVAGVALLACTYMVATLLRPPSNVMLDAPLLVKAHVSAAENQEAATSEPTGPIKELALMQAEKELAQAKSNKKLAQAQSANELAQAQIGELQRQLDVLSAKNAKTIEKMKELDRQTARNAMLLAKHAETEKRLLGHLESLRPPEAEKLEREIALLRQQSVVMRKKTDQLTTDNLLAWWRAMHVRKDARKVSHALALAEAEYQLRVLPWSEAMEDSKRLMKEILDEGVGLN